MQNDRRFQADVTAIEGSYGSHLLTVMEAVIGL